MHYISPTRRKSCVACVKSKRRCDLEYPSCRRCLVKDLDCTYPTPSVRNKVVTRQSSSDLSPHTAFTDRVIDSSAEFLRNDASASTDPLGHVGLPLSIDSNGSSPDRSQEQLGLSASFLLGDVPSEEPQLRRTLWPDVGAHAFLTSEQVQYVLRALRAYVPAMAYTGSTPFLHQNLWRWYQPESYQDCVSISALYLCKTSRNMSLIANNIDRKIANLTAASGQWGLFEHLAAVQALIIYQIIRLFDPSLNEQVQAQKHNLLLETWAAHLWKRSFNELTIFANSYETWVFNESLRRTIMISVFVRCAWSIYTRGGLADQVPVLVRIPFTKDLQAWTSDPEVWQNCVSPRLLEEDGLTVYGDYAHEWTHEDEVETLDPFAKLLLAACRGGDDPRLLS